MGFFDLPAPLWDLIDQGLAVIGSPAGLRVALYGALCGWLSMRVYRWLSRQSELAQIGDATRRLRAELAGYDGPFDGLMQRVRALMALSGRHLRLSFVPAMVGGLPLLFVLPWLSNRFGYELPPVGTPVEIRVDAASLGDAAHPSAEWRWSSDDVRWNAPASAHGGPAEDLPVPRGDVLSEAAPGEWTQADRAAGRISWTVPWPDTAAPIRLRAGDIDIVSLPLPAASPVVHRFAPIFNRLFGNPAGYLPDASPIEALSFSFPQPSMQPFGPWWLRHWGAIYFGALLLTSLWLKWRWRLH